MGKGGLRGQCCQQGFRGCWPAPTSRAGSSCGIRQAVTHTKSHSKQLAMVSLPTPKPLPWGSLLSPAPTSAPTHPAWPSSSAWPHPHPGMGTVPPPHMPNPLPSRQAVPSFSPAQFLPAQNVFTPTGSLPPSLSLPVPTPPY